MAPSCDEEPPRRLHFCDSQVAWVPAPTPTPELHVLVVMDTSHGMEEEQVALHEAIRPFLDKLRTGSTDRGRFAPPRHLTFEVINAGQGTSYWPEAGCDMSSRRPTCPRDLSSSTGQLYSGASCLLTPRAPTCPFITPFSHIHGHLRSAEPDPYTHDHPTWTSAERSLLILLISNGDDCTASDRSLHYPGGATELPLAHRCSEHAESYLTEVENYANWWFPETEGLNEVIFAPIVGIPTHLVPPFGQEPNYTALHGPEEARDPAMWPAPLTEDVRVSCTHDELGSAQAPVRITRLAEALHQRGARVVLSSICDGMDTALDRAAAAAMQRSLPICIREPLPIETGTAPSCRLRVFRRGTENPCPLPGWVPDPQSDRHCHICRLTTDGSPPDPTRGCDGSAGWWHESGEDDFCDGEYPAALRFTDGTQPQTYPDIICTPERMPSHDAAPGWCRSGSFCGMRTNARGERVQSYCAHEKCRTPCVSVQDCSSNPSSDTACGPLDDSGISVCYSLYCEQRRNEESEE